MTPEEAVEEAQPTVDEVKDDIIAGYDRIVDNIPEDGVGAALFVYFMHLQVQIERLYHDSLGNLNPNQRWIDIRAAFKEDNPAIWDFDSEKTKH